MIKDTANSTEHLNIYNMMLNENQVLLKIITVYGQPNKKVRIMQRLISILNKNLRIEAGVRTIILGDFNLDFNTNSQHAQQVKQQLEELGYQQQDHNVLTFQRKNTESSSLDHIFTNFNTSQHITTQHMTTSDHDYLEIQLDIEEEPYKVQPKEFYFSSTLNQPKEHELQNYLEYILKYLELVMDNRLNQKNMERIQRIFTDRTTIVMKSKPQAIYDIEKKFLEMLEKKMPYDQMKRELNIIRKYSYKEYIAKNIKLLHKDPKTYHKCLQNILSWNVEIGQQIGLQD